MSLVAAKIAGPPAAKPSANRLILNAAVLVGALTAVAKGLATVKELLIARSFGTSDELDAFLVAFLLPSFTINVIAGSFNTALIPVFIRVRDKEGRVAAQELLGSVLTLSIAILAAFTVVLFAASGPLLPLVGGSFSPEKLRLTRVLFAILLPALLLCGVTTTLGAVLNAERRFFAPALTPAVTPAVIMLALLAGAERWGIYAVAAGTVAGFALEGTILAGMLRRAGYRFWPRWHGWNQKLRDVLTQYLPMIAGAFLLSSTTVIDQAMAASLGGGQVAALSYGNKLVALLLAIGSMGLGTAVFPYVSGMVAARDWRGVRSVLRHYGRLVFVLSGIAAMLMMLFSEPIVRLLFERKEFTAEDTRLVSSIHIAYCLQIPFYLLGTVYVRAISSFRANQILMYGAAISLVLDIALNLVFRRWFGAPGIGLATAVVYLVSCLFLGAMLRRRLAREEAHG